MKKAIVLGPIFVGISMDVEGKFNELGNNSGRASTSYGGLYFGMAKQLAQDPDTHVIMLTALDTEAAPYIIRKLKAANIDTQYIVEQPGSLGFNLSMNVDGLIKSVHSHFDISRCIDQLELFKEEILTDAELFIAANSGYNPDDLDRIINNTSASLVKM